MSLTSALSNTAGALELFSTGIQVTSNNVANVNTPGYVRENLEIRSAPPARTGGLIVGNGVLGVGIRLQIDRHLEARIQTAQGDYAGANAMRRTYLDLETTLQELGAGNGISGQLTAFESSLQNVAAQPDSVATRQLAVQQASQLASTVRGLRSRVDNLRNSINGNISDAVDEANQLIDQIARLNKQITPIESQSGGASDAGALRSQRYAALDRLSQLVPIRTIEHDNGSVDVLLGNEHLIIPGDVQHLATKSSSDRGVTIQSVFIDGVNVPVTGNQGEIGGLQTARDTVLGGFVDQLDKFSSNLIFEFNKLHSSGQGFKGYTDTTGTYAVTDPTASLKAAGLKFTPQHGGFDVLVKNQSTGLTETTHINIDLDGISSNGNDTTLNSLAAQISGAGNVTATVTSDNKLKITAANGYEIQFSNDNSNVLASLGINTFFAGSSSIDIQVNSIVANDSSYFASAAGGGASDSSNAVKLADFANQKTAALGGLSVGDFYTSLVSSVGQASASQGALADGYQNFRDSLSSQKQQISGVSLDEELVRMMQYQHSYQAAARMVKAIDDLFSVLVQL